MEPLVMLPASYGGKELVSEKLSQTGSAGLTEVVHLEVAWKTLECPY